MTDPKHMTRKKMRVYAAKQGLRLRFNETHSTVVAEDRRTGQRIWSGPVDEIESRIRSRELL